MSASLAESCLGSWGGFYVVRDKIRLLLICLVVCCVGGRPSSWLVAEERSSIVLLEAKRSEMYQSNLGLIKGEQVTNVGEGRCKPETLWAGERKKGPRWICAREPR
jgi:hypothetical protein